MRDEGGKDPADATGGRGAKDIKKASVVMREWANEEIEWCSAQNELVEINNRLGAIVLELGLDVPKRCRDVRQTLPTRRGHNGRGATNRHVVEQLVKVEIGLVVGAALSENTDVGLIGVQRAELLRKIGNEIAGTGRVEESLVRHALRARMR